jgi:HPt (histidine-containing phosphotransfer) domain-containing protein
MDTDDHLPPSIAAAGPAFRQAYLSLRRQYTAQLPEKLQEARDALQACRDQPQDIEPLERLRRLMHTMAGTAPTIGFDAQGAYAARAEEAADVLLQQPQRTAADFTALDDLLGELAALGASPCQP